MDGAVFLESLNQNWLIEVTHGYVSQPGAEFRRSASRDRISNFFSEFISGADTLVPSLLCSSRLVANFATNAVQRVAKTAIQLSRTYEASQ